MGNETGFSQQQDELLERSLREMTHLAREIMDRLGAAWWDAQPKASLQLALMLLAATGATLGLKPEDDYRAVDVFREIVKMARAHCEATLASQPVEGV
jgi:hypothetical protein